MVIVSHAGIADARARSVAVDELVAPLLASLPPRVAAVALGAYGRRELTPHAEVELLLLHTGDLGSQQVTEQVWYPLWERKLHLDPAQRTIHEVQTEARQSLAITLRLFDARFVAGDKSLFEALKPPALKRDRPALRLRLTP